MKEVKNKSVAGSVKTFLARTAVQDPISHKNLMLFPLITESVIDFEYLTLDEALRDEQIVIGEVSPEGSVPEFGVRNKGNKPILLIHGEELRGAKQNRTLSTDIFVRGRSKIVIPVSCTQQGRWSYDKEEGVKVHSTEYVSPVKMRSSMSHSVSASLKGGKGFAANQSAVWNGVSRGYNAPLGVDSPTQAIDDAFRSRKEDLQKYLDALRPNGWNGMAIVISGEFVGADLFDSADTLKKLWDKLLRSYALEALVKKGESSAFAKKDIEEILASAKEAKLKIFKSVSLGYDVRLETLSVVGSALVYASRGMNGVVHLSLFRKETGAGGSKAQGAKMSSARDRGQNWYTRMPQ